jgi:hypothetical protein
MKDALFRDFKHTMDSNASRIRKGTHAFLSDVPAPTPFSPNKYALPKPKRKLRSQKRVVNGVLGRALEMSILKLGPIVLLYLSIQVARGGVNVNITQEPKIWWRASRRVECCVALVNVT